jgi:hypothetical protein
MTAYRGKPLSYAEFARLWADTSISIAQIGASLGVSEQAVVQRAKSRGLPLRGLRGLRGVPRVIQNDDEFTAMWEAGVGRAEMARHFGVCEPLIGIQARRLGLPKRRLHWRRALTVQGFLMAREAAVTRAAMRDSEMVDRIRNRWAA